MGDSGEKSPIKFFRWFWGFLKEKVFLQRFILNCFSKCNQHFQLVLIRWVLIAENITKMSHMQQWFYWNSTFQSWILLQLHCLHDWIKVFLTRTIPISGPGSKKYYSQQQQIYHVKCPWFWLWLVFVWWCPKMSRFL